MEFNKRRGESVRSVESQVGDWSSRLSSQINIHRKFVLRSAKRARAHCETGIDRGSFRISLIPISTTAKTKLI
jgi:hypothetical protein